MEVQFDHVDNPLTTQNIIYHTDTAPGPPPPTTPAVRQASPPPPTTDTALLLQRLQDLSEQVRQLQHSAHPTCQPHHTQVRHQPPPFTPTRQQWAPPISVIQGLVQVPPGALCYYHQRFGHLARNCQPPCTWRAAQAVGKLVGRRREAHTTAPAAASPQPNYTTTTTQQPRRAPTDANPAPTMRHTATHTTTTPPSMPPPPASSPNDRTLLWLEDVISGETFLVDSGSEGLKKGSQRALVWTEEAVMALEGVKDKLASSTMLVYPLHHAPTFIYTDASAEAVGTVLQQEIDGELRPIAFFSYMVLVFTTVYPTQEGWLSCCQWQILIRVKLL
ncbi:hypothetical protein Pmani_003914 [Petrolisthes manimaculis]|uniref:Reverse transcriptase/retrotransposon-derived protein RNase H-like domain-containing protein n=1 Tax=Petrolisthes manimaculis TaxID=1843537 RepID=A0AAE1QFL0_9EUCA|nr:hypothetical protein Pmani_003914 [Petrolisthes manimaculis]